MTAVPEHTAKKYRGHKLGGPDDLHTAWRLIAGSATDAAVALIDIANNCPVPGAKVRAAQLLLEMGGFRSAESLPVLPPEHDRALASTEGETSADRIRARLENLGLPEATTQAPTLDQLAQPVVVDADPTQP